MKTGKKTSLLGNHTTQTARVVPLPQTSLSLRKHGASSNKYVVILMYAHTQRDRVINNLCCVY